MGRNADSLLEIYRQKRDFARTAEPAGEVPRASGGTLAFTVQKHDATRLHYDFRIEWEGVLKSWAVTRGPSLDPADKRLAVRTEDHPMDYADFEGTIPKGSYGGGTVMLWDRGTWEPAEGDADAGLANGNLKMILHGERMTGRWVLVRMKPRGKETRENWLLIKEKDDVADPDRDILAADRSIKTGRTMAEIAAGGEAWSRPTVPPSKEPLADAAEPGGKSQRKARTKQPPEKSAAAPVADAGGKPRAPAKRREAPANDDVGTLKPPAFRPLQLATLAAVAPEGPQWLNEMKYDGYRVAISFGGGAARLYTRTGLDWTDRFAALLPAVTSLPCRSAQIDGEVVAFDQDGKADFSTLHKHLKDGGGLACFCFDLLSLDGEDLTGEPLVKRKARLQTLLAEHGSPDLLFSDHVVGSGPSVLRQLCASGHEGIVAKKADAPYRPGRGMTWLKVKCTRRQEFVIGGFSLSDKKGRPFSSILVGVREGDALRYRGRVGSGFDDDMLDELKARFDERAMKASPFEDLPKPIARDAVFVKPDLVAEIDFAEFTADGQIRHGVFKGLREDKPAAEIVDETPKAIPAKASSSAASAPEGAPPRRPSRAATPKNVVVAGITISHPDRVVFERPDVTKLDLAEYYAAVAGRMLAHAGSRPLSLVRCPGGRQKKCFFQKHDSGGFPDAIRKVAIREKDGDTADYLFVDDASGLVAAVQMNTLEFHIWGATRDRLEKPDRLVFDLDPDESLTFADVKAAAGDIRARLKTLGLETFPMVTGGKGIHVVAPLSPRQGWDAVKTFAHDLSYRLAAEEPARFVATMSKAKRRGRIFIDWLRNERGQTAIAPYSTRSRDGAPVATPVGWDELRGLDAANGFRPADVLERILAPDPWAGYRDVRQSLTQTMLKRVAGSR